MFKYIFDLINDTAWYNGLILKNGDKIIIFVYLGMIFAVAAAAYLLGSINTAVITSKLMYGEDIRTKGSGNAGMTNMMRSYGIVPALLTLLGDMLKTLFGMFFGTCVLGLNGAYIAGLFCVLGHIFPIYYRFKGGKGVAATVMVVLYLDLKVFVLFILLFVGIVWVTKYLSLASVMCELFMPLLLYRADNVVTDRWLRLIIMLILGLTVVYMHRSNIKRIMDGNENKFSFKKTKKPIKNTGESLQNDNLAENNSENTDADIK